jgi:hypothetical protein
MLKKDTHGKGDRVLRAVDVQETLEMVLATATRKAYRVLHANKEIRLNIEVPWQSLPQEANGVTVRPSTVASIG